MPRVRTQGLAHPPGLALCPLTCPAFEPSLAWTAAETEGIIRKRQQAESLLPGQLGVRNRALKLAVVTAKGAVEMCEELLNEMPDREPGEEAYMQFEWLPTKLWAARGAPPRRRPRQRVGLALQEAACGSALTAKQTL